MGTKAPTPSSITDNPQEVEKEKFAKNIREEQAEKVEKLPIVVKKGGNMRKKNVPTREQWDTKTHCCWKDFLNRGNKEKWLGYHFTSL